MSGYPAIYVGEPRFEVLPSSDPGVLRWRFTQPIFGVDLSGALPLLTLPVHDLPSDKDVTVPAVTRRDREGA